MRPVLPSYQNQTKTVTRTLQTDVYVHCIHGHRNKNSQQNVSKSYPAIYKKGYMPELSGVHTRLV